MAHAGIKYDGKTLSFEKISLELDEKPTEFDSLFTRCRQIIDTCENDSFRIEDTQECLNCSEIHDMIKNGYIFSAQEMRDVAFIDIVPSQKTRSI